MTIINNEIFDKEKELADGLNSVYSVEVMIRCDDELTIAGDSSNALNSEDILSRSSIIGDCRGLVSFIHPDDLELLRSKIDACSYLTASHCNIRFLCDGEVHRMHCRCIQCPDKSDYSHRLINIAFIEYIHWDESVSLCQEMLEEMPAAAWEYDIKSDTILYTPVSARAEVFSLSGHAFIDMIEKTLILHPDFRVPYRKLRYAFLTGNDDINMELKLLGKNGTYQWYSVTGTVVADENGEITGYTGQLRNIDSSLSSKVFIKTDDDPLTGLMNRHGMERCVARRLSQGVKSSALLLLDVDDFNPITQQLGKHFSDALLIDIGGVLCAAISPTDFICRVSKDIFAVLLVEPESFEAVQSKASLFTQTLSHCYLNTERTKSVTCCIGVSYDGNGHQSYEQLYYQADTALAYAKSCGKNHIEFFRDDLDYLISDLRPRTENFISVSEPASDKSTDLLSQVVDVLFESRELSSSINIVLSLIGHQFGLQSAEILEFTDDYQNVYSTYRWNLDYHSISKPAKSSVDVVEEAILLDVDAEYLVCRDTGTLASEHPNVVRFYQDLGASSFVHIPIRDGARISGVICFGCANPSVLRQEVVRELVLIAKIISGYITRLQSKLDIDRLIATDTLTGCLNLGRFISEAKRIVHDNPAKRYVIIYSDIDRFKFINDSFGYLAGDKVLIDFSRIITASLGPDELIGRIDADKFVSLLQYSDNELLLDRITEIDCKVNSMSIVTETNYKIPVRCGICPLESGDDITSVIDKANLARKSVKNIHISTYTFYDETMKSRIIQRKEIEDVMYDALSRGEFVVYLQPKFSLLHNDITGAEALVRWERPGYGLLKPDEFIPVFEENGFIIKLDFYVLECVCKKLRRDIDNDLIPYPISVNFSRVHLDSDNFIMRIKDCLTRYDLPPHLIEIEITESALVGNEDYLVDMMSALHSIGLVVSMDDFGSGYSTLNLLKKFPVDVLKIDKEFFADSGDSERERCIIENVVNMAKSLNIRVVSEGVETVEQADFLRGVNCDIAQGYLYAKPMDMHSYEHTYQPPVRSSVESKQ